MRNELSIAEHKPWTKPVVRKYASSSMYLDRTSSMPMPNPIRNAVL
jgi:hypothetical protein